MRDVPLPHESPTARVTVTFVGDDLIHSGARTLTSTWSRGAHLIEHGRQLGAVMAVSWRDHHQKRAALAVTGEMDLARQPALAAPQPFIGWMLDPLVA